MIRRRVEAFDRRQLVIRIERRRMTYGAAFTVEDILSARSQAVEPVRVRWGLERINVKRHRVELFVAVTAARSRVGRRSEIARRGDKPTVAGQVVSALIQRSVTHQVHDRAMSHQAGVIEVLPLFDSDQVWNLRRIEWARTLAADYAGRHRRVPFCNLSA